MCIRDRCKRVSTGCGRKSRSGRVWHWICGVRPKSKASNKPLQHFIVHELDKPGRSATVSPFSTHIYTQYSTNHCTKGLFRALNWASSQATAQLGMGAIGRWMVAYLRAADNVSGPLPIWLRSMHQPAISTCHVFSSPSPSLLDCP